MKFHHGGLSMEIPENWIDQSQVAFAEPVDTSVAEGMAKAAAQSGAPMHVADPGLQKPRANFVLSTKNIEIEDFQPRQFVEGEMKFMMSQLSVGFQSDLRWEKMANTEAAVVEIELSFEEMTLRQLHALAVIGRKLLHFCGTATPGDFERARKGFLETMASIQIDGESFPAAASIPGPPGT